MLIQYTDADGCTIEIEVYDEVGDFIISSEKDEARNDRTETRRHTYLSEFEYEDARYFDSGIDIERSVTETDAVRSVLAQMTERERFLVTAVHLGGRSYTEIAKAEVKHPSSIMRETKKATAKLKKLYRDGEK